MSCKSSSAWFLASLPFSIPKPRLALRCRPREVRAEAPPSGALPSARRLRLYPDTVSSPRNTSPPWSCPVLCARIVKNKSLSWHLQPHPAPQAPNFWLNLSLEPETLPSTDTPLSPNKTESLGHPDPACCLLSWVLSFSLPQSWFVHKAWVIPPGG